MKKVGLIRNKSFNVLIYSTFLPVRDVYTEVIIFQL